MINKLKNKTSSGKDGISNKLLKSIKSEISEAIAIIINQSILTGIFPDQLKLAKVKPLYKKGDKCCLNNYRPISLLPTISQIFERVMYQYFNENKLLCEQQYGFRSQHSTELAAVKLVDYVIKEMDSNKKVNTPVALFLDISWKKHVAMITNKLSKISGVLHRLKYIYPQNILETIYKSLFIPHINYGLLVWGRNLDSVAKLQKRAIRTITNSNFIAHSEPLQKELRLLNVYDIHYLNFFKFMYKLYHDELPIYFDNYIFKYSLKKLKHHIICVQLHFLYHK